MSQLVIETSGGKKYDGGKLDWTLLPYDTLESVVKVMQLGADKYGRENWKKVSPERYEKAMLRHITAYLKGEEIDCESGESHLVHAICCQLFIINLKGKK
jgi:hypothetical protein